MKSTRPNIVIGAVMFAVGAVIGGFSMHVFDHRPHSSPLTPANGEAQSNLVITWLPDTVTRWKPQIEKYSAVYQIDPNLLAIMMTVESGGDPNADSGVAKGLMQVTDPTAGDIAKKYLKAKVTSYDLKKPDTSIEFGAAYVRYLIDRFGHPDQGPAWDETVSLVAAGYNGGPGGAIAYRDHKWKGLESYDRQTLTYARYVRVMWQERHDPLSFAYHYWSVDANGNELIDAAKKYNVP